MPVCVVTSKQENEKKSVKVNCATLYFILFYLYFESWRLRSVGSLRNVQRLFLQDWLRLSTLASAYAKTG